MDLFHMRMQRPFHTEKREKNLFLAFEIESNMQSKTSFEQQFLKNFHLGLQNLVLHDHMRSRPQFHAAVLKKVYGR